VRFSFLIIVVVPAVAGMLCACRESVPKPDVAPSTQPAVPTPVAAGAEPGPPPATQPATPAEPPLDSFPEPQRGWLQIVRLAPGTEGGWATGRVETDRNRVCVETQNVTEFVLDQTRLNVRWDRRVILRINGRPAELLRKKDPAIHFQQSPGGAWEVVPH